MKKPTRSKKRSYKKQKNKKPNGSKSSEKTGGETPDPVKPGMYQV
jgi:hypothetical protein